MRYARLNRLLLPNGTDGFALKAGLLGGFSIPFATGVAVFVDALNEAVVREIYGITREHYPGEEIFLLGIASFFIIYLVNRGGPSTSHATRKGLFTFLGFLAVGFISLLDFQPFPHLGVLGPVLAYSTLLGLIAMVYHLEVGSNDLVGAGIDIRARIEVVKLEFELWFRSLILLVTIVIAGGAIVFFNLFDTSAKYYRGDLAAAYPLSVGLSIQALFFMLLVAALVWLIFGKLGKISKMMKSIKKQPFD